MCPVTSSLLVTVIITSVSCCQHDILCYVYVYCVCVCVVSYEQCLTMLSPRLSDRCRVGEFRGTVKREKALEPLELKDFPEPPLPVTNEESPDIRSTAALYDPLPVTSAPCPAYHRATSISYQSLETDLLPSDESYTEPQTSIPQLYTQLQPGTRRTGPVSPPRQDHSKYPQNTHSQESLSGSQGRASASHVPVSSHFASGPTHSPRGDSEQSRGLVEREQEAVHQVVPSNPGSALPATP